MNAERRARTRGECADTPDAVAYAKPRSLSSPSSQGRAFLPRSKEPPRPRPAPPISPRPVPPPLPPRPRPRPRPRRRTAHNGEELMCVPRMIKANCSRPTAGTRSIRCLRFTSP